MSTPTPFSGASFNFDEMISRLDTLNRQLEAEKKAAETADDKRVARARSGELGLEWKKLRERIDSGQTSLEQIFSGEDTSREAQEVCRLAQRNLAAMRDAWQQQQNAGQDSPLDEMERARCGEGADPRAVIPTISLTTGGSLADEYPAS
ncbi:hypothetical protein [Schaalia sp. Marseille-Q2122]|uniref:hypothetical protein n=1 Tax=Schaalia sp. Marseille-Q2122 TaxID=2736604 RepID=UPI00158EF483|nr:hypothetical protein [Schaalia sp. Marseille-Q2122]